MRRRAVFDLLSITLPIFLLIGLGYAAVRLGAVDRPFIDGLGLFVLNFALPALVLHALLSQDLRATFSLSYLIAYAGGSLAVFLGVMAAFALLYRRGLTHSAIAALGGSSSNSGFVGFPIASLAVGAPALTALPLAMLVENVLIIPLALALAQAGAGSGERGWAVLRRSLVRLARMPLILAILLGTLLSALGVSLPAPLATAIGMGADASIACALFVVGGTLAGLKVAAVAADLPLILVGKLVLHPLAVGVGFALLGNVPPWLALAGILLASAPMLTVYPIFGQQFGLQGLCAAALVAATVASFLTITVVLGLAGPG